MNIYRHKESKALYILDRLILDIYHLNRNANAGIYATPYKHSGEALHFLSKDGQDCLKYIEANFDIVATTDPDVKRKYTVVGDNNFWYASTGELTLAELDGVLNEIKEGIANNQYEHGSKPTLLYVHEVGEISYQVEL